MLERERGDIRDLLAEFALEAEDFQAAHSTWGSLVMLSPATRPSAVRLLKWELQRQASELGDDSDD